MFLDILAPIARKHLGLNLLTSSRNRISTVTIRNCFTHGCFCETLNEQLQGILKEEYEEWMSIAEDIPVAATLADLQIRQAVGEQDQAINVDDSEGDECIEENYPTNIEMRQAFDILEHGVEQTSTNFRKNDISTNKLKVNC
ncbi:hypothetical protein AVEN_233232-1 [Araneus ventricosus]|uniref:Uncharacterized protein n=1 Tax=Araneus ventricosus TaxID=182803 RepID=A0A4Y2ELL6_ARAVE|nr:hypothetical protein AVEN_233232-1 [Araneus ventricosus]